MATIISPIQYLRQFAGPIDADSVFETTAARNAYLTSPRRYPGQLVYDLQADAAFFLNADGNAWVPASGGGTGDPALEARVTAIEDILASSGIGELIVVDDSVVGIEDTLLTGNIFANDQALTGTLRLISYTIGGLAGVNPPGPTITVPGYGLISIQENGAYSYTPQSEFSGTVPDIFYLVTNGRDVRGARFSISILPVNDAPFPIVDATGVPINTAATLDLLANDYDVENQTITVSSINGVGPIVASMTIPVTNGSIFVNPDLTITITPNVGFTGNITFPYVITDGTTAVASTVLMAVGVENVPLISPVVPVVLPDDFIDQASVNFGLTARNLVGNAYNNGVNATVPYLVTQGYVDLTLREPWLYDRATTMYKQYLRTGDTSYRTLALSLAQTYFSNIQVSGGLANFGLQGINDGDVKYLYGIVAHWYERETGDSQYRPLVAAMRARSLIYHPIVYSTDESLWTERNHTYALLNCLAQYWVNNDQTALDDANGYFDTLETLSALYGAPLHPYTQHEGGDVNNTALVASPWMGSFLVEAVIQLYRTTLDNRCLQWISGFTDFMMEYGFYIGTGSEIVNGSSIDGLPVPVYLTGPFATFSETQDSDKEHAVDVAVALQKGIWAKRQLGLPVTGIQQQINLLMRVARYNFDYWTRNTVGLPRYRVNPPRKYGWWFTNRYSSIYAAGPLPPPPTGPGVTTAPVISGSVDAGSTLTVTPGTYTGSPVPTVSRNWQRNGVNISGATGLTYVTNLTTDVGANITCLETISNTGGTITSSSNTIVPVLVGRPEFGTQPQTQIGTTGSTVTFTVSVTGDPVIALNWQYNDGSGWATVVGGTGNGTTSYTTPSLSGANDLWQYRCVANNGIGGDVFSNAATLYMATQKPAFRYTGNTDGATLARQLGGLGFSDFALIAVVRIGTSPGANSDVLKLSRPSNGRQFSLGYNGSSQFALKDSQNGSTVFGTQPPLNTWIIIGLSGPADAGGTQIGMWKDLTTADAPVFVTRTAGIEGSVTSTNVFLNDGGTGNGIDSTVDFQYVRGYQVSMNQAQLESEISNYSAAGAEFWWVWDGAGAVVDASPNNFLPVNTGTPAVVADGPILPGLIG